MGSIEHIKKLVSKGETLNALLKFKKLVRQNSQLEGKIILLEAELNSIKKNNIYGVTIDYQKENEVNLKLLTLLKLYKLDLNQGIVEKQSNQFSNKQLVYFSQGVLLLLFSIIGLKDLTIGSALLITIGVFFLAIAVINHKKYNKKILWYSTIYIIIYSISLFFCLTNDDFVNREGEFLNIDINNRQDKIKIGLGVYFIISIFTILSLIINVYLLNSNKNET